ncbi:hypothetical protein BKA62DRAFT_700025 [Auriculariales sp. MPI-PUGE-AT-0066]|nr:hypothetical protein BKA62DRAFT_700025 [Auriculariales sp. MPI-PUGE-AT-0066]
MPFPLTCSGVGDVLALVKLGIDIVTFINGCRSAPAECRALHTDFTSLERLLEASIPAIEGIQNVQLRDIVIERTMVVHDLVLSGLQLVTRLELVNVTSPVPATHRRSILKLANRAQKCVQWKVRHSADAKGCQAKIDQALQQLMFATLLSRASCDDVQMVKDFVSDTARLQQQCIDVLRMSEVESRTTLDNISSAIGWAQQDITKISTQLESMDQLTRLHGTVNRIQHALRDVRHDTATTREAVANFCYITNEERVLNHTSMKSVERKLDLLVELASPSNADASWTIISLSEIPRRQEVQVVRQKGVAWYDALEAIADAINSSIQSSGDIGALLRSMEHNSDSSSEIFYPLSNSSRGGEGAKDSPNGTAGASGPSQVDNNHGHLTRTGVGDMKDLYSGPRNPVSRRGFGRPARLEFRPMLMYGILRQPRGPPANIDNLKRLNFTVRSPRVLVPAG